MYDLRMEILKEFDISEVDSMKCLSRGEREMWYVNDKYFLKKFTDLNVLEKMLFINIELYQAGVPVAKHYKTSSGKSCVEINNEYYTLAEKISGSHEYVQDIDYRKGAFLLGQNISKLHMALLNLSHKAPYSIPNTSDMHTLKSWALNTISEKNLAIRKEIIDYCIGFDELYDSLPRQVIHTDLHRSNVLFENGEVSAFLDLEVLQTEVRLKDICYYMNAEINCRDITDELVEEWLETFKSLLSGYNTISELKKEEFYAVPYILILHNLNAVALFASMEFPNIDKNIKSLNWLYDNKNKFSFSIKDMA